MTPEEIRQGAEWVKRIWDIAAPYLGRVYRPNYERAMATARADELAVLSVAMSKARDEHGLDVKFADGQWTLESAEDTPSVSLMNLAEHAHALSQAREQKQLLNMSDVVTQALTAVIKESSVPDAVPSEDFTARFFAHVQDVNDDEARTIWSKVLADEVRRPGSFSLRALDILRNLSRVEAEKFSRVASRVCNNGRDEVLFLFEPQWLATHRDISDDVIGELKDLGLISQSSKGFSTFINSENQGLQIIVHNKTHALVGSIKQSSTLAFDSLSLTKAGAELAVLTDQIYDEEYLLRSAHIIADQNVTVFLGVKMADGRIKYTHEIVPPKIFEAWRRHS